MKQSQHATASLGRTFVVHDLTAVIVLTGSSSDLTQLNPGTGSKRERVTAKRLATEPAHELFFSGTSSCFSGRSGDVALLLHFDPRRDLNGPKGVSRSRGGSVGFVKIKFAQMSRVELYEVCVRLHSSPLIYSFTIKASSACRTLSSSDHRLTTRRICTTPYCCTCHPLTCEASAMCCVILGSI